MRRGALLLVLCGGAAAAHFVPGERIVVVQAEPGSAAVLVTYRPAARVRDLLLAASVAAPAPERRRRLESLYAARGLAPIVLMLDGREAAPAAVETKLTDDPPGSGRLVLAALVTVKVPAGAHLLAVSVGDSDEPTASQWLDRSGGRVVEAGPAGPERWIQGKARLELRWTP